MNYRVVNNGNIQWIECNPGSIQIRDEQDALEWVAICGELAIDRLLLYGENLTEDFFNLKTGVAGRVLQKFSTYRLRVAAVLPAAFVLQGRFGEMVLEANRGRQFHACVDRTEAVRWLVDR
jgi:hypothetical protein